MDALTSPLATVLLNIVAQVLVSKGILDQRSSAAFVQVTDNILVSLTTLIIGLFSIHHMMNWHKTKLVSDKPPMKSMISQTTSTPLAIGQSGLPIDKVNVQNAPESPVQTLS